MQRIKPILFACAAALGLAVTNASAEPWPPPHDANILAFGKGTTDQSPWHSGIAAIDAFNNKLIVNFEVGQVYGWAYEYCSRDEFSPDWYCMPLTISTPNRKWRAGTIYTGNAFPKWAEAKLVATMTEPFQETTDVEYIFFYGPTIADFSGLDEDGGQYIQK
ncbi:MAG: hypothetical protein AMXMBFR59_17770 [Rhodanobacteraceae bacterium]